MTIQFCSVPHWLLMRNINTLELDSSASLKAQSKYEVTGLELHCTQCTLQMKVSHVMYQEHGQ